MSARLVRFLIAEGDAAQTRLIVINEPGTQLHVGVNPQAKASGRAIFPPESVS